MDENQPGYTLARGVGDSFEMVAQRGGVPNLGLQHALVGYVLDHLVQALFNLGVTALVPQGGRVVRRGLESFVCDFGKGSGEQVPACHFLPGLKGLFVRNRLIDKV